MVTSRLIVNESYWSLFNNKNSRVQEFIVPRISDFDSQLLSIPLLTRNLALIMQNNDSDKTSMYGIEIKTNGSSRSSRIPLVRFSQNNQSMWKIISDIKSYEKAVIDLKDLCYHLEQTRKTPTLPLPKKVIVLAFFEKRLVDDREIVFIEKIAKETQTMLVSLEYILDLVRVGNSINLNKILFSKNALLDSEPE